MRTNILTVALSVPDQELLPKIEALATTERETTAELVAHLAALELRPSLHAARGYGSLFAYCTQALHLSEDAACNRIDAARACRRFPLILDLLAAGSVTLTSIRMLKRHLTDENHEAVLRRAVDRTKEEIEALIAELDPKPDIPASVRRLPGPRAVEESIESMPSAPVGAAASQESASGTTLPGLFEVGGPSAPGAAVESVDPSTQPVEMLGDAVIPSARTSDRGSAPSALRPDRTIVKPLSPERYRVQFTVGQEDYEKLKRLQTLLRREIPNGDPGTLYARALALLLEKVEKQKLGATRGSGASRSGAAASGSIAGRAYESRIRSGTDKGLSGRSRHIPNQIRRTVWWRDRGQCAFVSKDGHRCTEKSFLELHHIQPYALDGPATIGNIALRCRIHNAYEAEVVFGTRAPATATDP